MNLGKFSEIFDKKKTFRPKKKFQPGTMKYSLHKQAQASLNSGINLRQVVKLPKVSMSFAKFILRKCAKIIYLEKVSGTYIHEEGIGIESWDAMAIWIYFGLIHHFLTKNPITRKM